jgi:putative resolvase
MMINQGIDTTFEEKLASNVLEIITVFSTRLYGSRSCKNEQVLTGVQRTVAEAPC